MAGALKLNSTGGGSAAFDPGATASNLTFTFPTTSGQLVVEGAPFSGGTANGVVYLNGSKVPTTGSALTFDGSYLNLASGSGKGYTLQYGGDAASRNWGFVRDFNVYGDAAIRTSSSKTLGLLDVTAIAFDANAANTQFYAAGSEQMRLTSTGLGIGTNSPGQKLQVAGSQLLSSPGSAVYTYFDSIANSIGRKSTGELVLTVAAGSPTVFVNSTTEYMRINAGAPILCLAGGNTSATGTGIAFPATQNASSDANTLDDYEEGTWTPAITFSGASVGVTYSSRSGTYTKIGRLVFMRFAIVLSNKGSSTGNVQVSGMPFTAASTSPDYPSVGVLNCDDQGSSMPTGTYGLVWSDGYIYWRYNNSVGWSPITNSNVTNNTTLYGAFTYQTST